jgi:hypothetical protein
LGVIPISFIPEIFVRLSYEKGFAFFRVRGYNLSIKSRRNSKMKFKPDVITNQVAIGTLNVGDTFIDAFNFDETKVLMVIKKNGYDCAVEFGIPEENIAVVDLTTGELWAYKSDEGVIKVEVGEITYKRE